MRAVIALLTISFIALVSFQNCSGDGFAPSPLSSSSSGLDNTKNIDDLGPGGVDDDDSAGLGFIDLEEGTGFAELSWDPNSESDLAGYQVYWGTSPGVYDDSQDVGKGTMVDGRVHFTLEGLPAKKTYYFSVTAYNKDKESDHSNEVSKEL